jgi:hypothetical protein
MQLRWPQESAADLERDRRLPLRTHTGPCGAPHARAVRSARHVGDVPESREAWQERRAHASSSCRPCPYIVAYAVRGDAIYCKGRSSGRDRTTGPAGAIGRKAPRHRWHSRQRRQWRLCNLQNLKGRVGFESHPLRFPRSRSVIGSGGTLGIAQLTPSYHPDDSFTASVETLTGRGITTVQRRQTAVLPLTLVVRHPCTGHPQETQMNRYSHLGSFSRRAGSAKTSNFHSVSR